MTLKFAHRGISSLDVENTPRATERALKMDTLDGSEFDVIMAKDGLPAWHAETFKPDAGFKRLEVADSERSTWYADRTIEELKQLDVGSWKGPEFAGLRMATLKEMLSLNWGNKIALIELKDPLHWDSLSPAPYHDEFGGRVQPDIQEFLDAGKRAFILSFSPHLLRVCSQVLPAAPRVQVVSEFETFKNYINASVLDFQSFALGESLVLAHPEAVEMGHKQGKNVFIYEHTSYKPVNYQEKVAERNLVWRRLTDLGVDGIISNYAQEFGSLARSTAA